MRDKPFLPVERVGIKSGMNTNRFGTLVKIEKNERNTTKFVVQREDKKHTRIGVKRQAEEGEIEEDIHPTSNNVC